MHIIVDIRDAHPLLSLTERYGEAWGNLWKKYHPRDTISYLIFDTQAIKSDDYLQVPRGPGSWWKKRKLIAQRGNEVFRCVNFSVYDPYDRHIPTLTHIFHNRSWLYPNEGESSYMARKAYEYRMHRIIQDSSKIIVPSMSVGLECVELWGVEEGDIEIIPYIPLTRGECDRLTGTQLQIGESFFLYDGGFGSESNIINVLKGFELYRHIYGGTSSLILHGAPGHELSSITQMIRAFELTEYVKLVGVLEGSQHEWLYENATAWIMLGLYYSGGPRIELAYTHGLPMILSDLAAVRSYGKHFIHPNHVALELAPLLKSIESGKNRDKRVHEYTEIDIVQAYETHLAGNKNKK